jgi:thiamine kinase-like enzyme
MNSIELVITNFIEAELVGFGELSETILGQLAEKVGILHNCRSQLEFEFPFIEQFQIDFEDALIRSFETLTTIQSTESVGKQLLRDTLLPAKTEVLSALEYLKGLQVKVRQINKTKVICHTDLHGGNLMLDEKGILYILDWENAMIAPPEHDLFVFVGQPSFWEIIWPRYNQYYPVASIDCDILSFYFYRRILEDVYGFVLRIMQDEGDEERDRKDIGWLQENLNGFGEVDKTVSSIRKKLS